MLYDIADVEEGSSSKIYYRLFPTAWFSLPPVQVEMKKKKNIILIQSTKEVKEMILDRLRSIPLIVTIDPFRFGKLMFPYQPNLMDNEPSHDCMFLAECLIYIPYYINDETHVYPKFCLERIVP